MSSCPQSFRCLAKTLGAALADREDLQMDVLTALRRLVRHNKDIGEEAEEAAAVFVKIQYL